MTATASSTQRRSPRSAWVIVAKREILSQLQSKAFWVGTLSTIAIVVVAFFVPARSIALFAALAFFIGIVLGGSQALSRSLYSQLIPHGKEAEYFSLYQAMERGTSWFGTLIFGLVYQATLSYRSAILALIVFFVVGGVLLSRVKMRQGIIDAGNEVPHVI